MEQYQKLFDKAEIEYITPFLKLWMSFNNWYKQDLPDKIKTDRGAIDEYKKQGKIKDEFLKIFDSSSDEGIKFNYALFELVLNLNNYELKNKREVVKYFCIAENKDGRSGDFIYISEQEKRFQILGNEKEKFFKETLDIIYCIRTNLVHGSFDIENSYFQKVVESSYKILQPIMYKILEFDQVINLKEENSKLKKENESLKLSLKLANSQTGEEQ